MFILGLFSSMRTDGNHQLTTMFINRVSSFQGSCARYHPALSGVWGSPLLSWRFGDLETGFPDLRLRNCGQSCFFRGTAEHATQWGISKDPDWWAVSLGFIDSGESGDLSTLPRIVILEPSQQRPKKPKSPWGFPSAVLRCFPHTNRTNNLETRKLETGRVARVGDWRPDAIAPLRLPRSSSHAVRPARSGPVW